MDKAVDFLKRNWWVLPATLVTGFCELFWEVRVDEVLF